MCFNIHSSNYRTTEDLRQQEEPIKAYKILTKDLRSPYFPEYKWEFGKEMVARETLGTQITQEEIHDRAVSKGIHLYREPYRYQYPCPYRYLCQYQRPYPCRYRYQNPLRGLCMLRRFEVEVEPNLIVIANKEQMVVTAARLIKEI